MTKRDPIERAKVYAQFDKIQRMILEKAHARDIDQELDTLSRLTRIRRTP